MKLELERERLQLKATLEREKLGAQREREQMRIRAQMARIEAEKSIEDAKLIAEKARQDERLAAEAAKIRSDIEREERARPVDTIEVKVKRYGDAIRNSMYKLSDSSPLEFIPFIGNFEHLCSELRVPPELRVNLLTPYLPDHCRTLISRMGSTDKTSYDKVKTFLMEQLRLVPSYFCDEFNKMTRKYNETFKSYIYRLSTMLDYYLSSRKVKSFDDLCNLLVCDRIKSVLSDGALGHVLRFESNLDGKWASKDQLADTLDVYFNKTLTSLVVLKLVP